MQPVSTSTPPVPPTGEVGGHQGTRGRSLSLGYGRFIHRARWFIVVIWALGLAMSVPFAATISNKLQSSIAQPGGTESARVNQQLVNSFHQPESQLLVVFHS